MTPHRPTPPPADIPAPCEREEVRRADGRPDIDLLGPGPPVEVHWLDGAAAAAPSRAPHRHDYHELLWLRAGRGQQRVDGEPLPLVPGSVTLIGRGRVHQLVEAEALHGAVIRFGEEVIHGEAAGRTAPGWLLTGLGARSVAVPPSDHDAFEGVVRALHAEAVLPPDPRSPDVLRHLVSVLLLWIERWYDAGRTERRAADDAETQLHRRFAAVLEADYARHHDAAHYAAALRVPPAVLSRALVRVTGRSTKELVLDRVMLEAARLLRYTDRSVGEIAFQVGFDDQLYFSRAFRRRFGRSPLAYRAAARGIGAPA